LQLAKGSWQKDFWHNKFDLILDRCLTTCVNDVTLKDCFVTIPCMDEPSFAEYLLTTTITIINYEKFK